MFFVGGRGSEVWLVSRWEVCLVVLVKRGLRRGEWLEVVVLRVFGVMRLGWMVFERFERGRPAWVSELKEPREHTPVGSRQGTRWMDGV